jgi:glycyl-tRNA synthetase beta chain
MPTSRWYGPPFAMPPTLPLLLEIGTEELPSSFVDAALAALPKIAADELAQSRLAHSEVRALGTPRRLAVLVRDVATKQLDLDEEVVGPPEAAAFRDGRPTKAAEAFAAKVGAEVSSLSVIEKPSGPKQRPGRYVVARRVEAGLPATRLLSGVLERICAAVPFKKSMRWGDLDVTFGRPVQWLVALLGSEPVAFDFAGVRSGRSSRGHRFLSPQAFDVEGPATYVEQLRTRHVLVDRDERVRTMMDRVAAAARATGGTYDREPLLVSENASLVEEPYVVTGSFDPALLALPAVVIRAVARGHQRYFCVEKEEDVLLPYYLAVVGTCNRPDLIAKGTDRVMRGRLADARFFWEEDGKTPLDARYDKLAGIVFHHRLGTVHDKVQRIERLAALIGDTLDLDGERKADIARAARLCKCDLLTLMVGEFPELQGHMGRAYAIAQKESPQVADAIRDHYKPLAAQDDVAADGVSAAIALADRIDTLVGCFAVGLAPTGAADPFALRRACIGALRTLLDRGYASLAFSDLVAVAYEGYTPKNVDLSKAATIAKLEEFATERFRGLLAGATSTAVADAVLAGSGPAALRNVVAALGRARALQAVVDANEPWLDKAKIVAKRLAGISREAQPTLHEASAFAGSKKTDDVVIQQLVRDLHDIAAGLSSEQAVRSALVAMGRFATELDRVFLETLVNDPADALTKVRLETLAHGAQSMLRIADFSKLS